MRKEATYQRDLTERVERIGVPKLSRMLPLRSSSSVKKLGSQDWLRSFINIRSAPAMSPWPRMLGGNNESGRFVEWCAGSCDCMGGGVRSAW